ncbi:MAG: hypothetical protein GXY10_07645 [Clostridiales bacterium]|nr:hypothetical protein [Clostridiales bacterium]
MADTNKKVHVDKGREGKLIPTKVMISLIAAAVLVVLTIGVVFGMAGFSAIANNEHTREEAVSDANTYANTILRITYPGQTFIQKDSDVILVIGDKLLNSYYKYEVEYESKDYEITLEVNYETNDIIVKDVEIDD